jgi:hypothetical protein
VRRYHRPYWAKLDFVPEYPFEAHVLHVSSLLSGFHRSEYANVPSEDPYAFASAHGIAVDSLADYVGLLDRMMAMAKAKGAVGLKSTRAYQRTLDFPKVPAERAAEVFGRPSFEIFMSASHPLSLHGHGRDVVGNLQRHELFRQQAQRPALPFRGAFEQARAVSRASNFPSKVHGPWLTLRLASQCRLHALLHKTLDSIRNKSCCVMLRFFAGTRKAGPCVVSRYGSPRSE